jgi:DNA mismatch repair protein MutS
MGLTKLGLVEITRKKVRQNFDAIMYHDCPCCGGRGRVKSPEAIVFDLKRELYKINRHSKNSGGQLVIQVSQEVAEILKNATSKSLVILDEIGRGTSTFDGISIAKSVAEHINGKAIGCKTLFATHYHELIALEKKNKGIRNFSVSVSKTDGELKFLHKIVEGGVDDSYGIEVAKLAGLPEKVISHAKSVLKKMEQNSKIEFESELLSEEESKPQIDFALISKEKIYNKLRTLDTDNITPIEALRILTDLVKEAN